MKRILSLLAVLALVISMVPNVFAAKDSIDMDELLGTLVYLDSVDMIEVALDEGTKTKTYKWTPDEAGILGLSFYAELPEGTTLEVVMTQGENSVTYNPEEAFQLDVVAGTEVVIKVKKTGDAALAFTMYGNVMPPLGTEGNPIFLMELENQVKVETAPAWFQCYFSGTTMTVTGTGAYTVTVDGQATAAVDGVVTMPVSTPNPRMPFVFTIDNVGEYTIQFAYPAGSFMNPAALVLGENTAEVAEGSQGYYFKWTAEASGTLSITMPAGNWSYTLNNLTAGVYGDSQWSDSEPVQATATLEVKTGDEIQLIVNTYDPENPWGAPAGKLVVTAAFEEASYVVGDLDGVDGVTEDDAVYLLQSILMPDFFPVEQPADFDKNGVVDEDDAVYLLQHVLMPDVFPL